MASLARGSGRLALTLEHAATKFFAAKASRQLSQAATKCKILEGSNGERIFTSPHANVQIPPETIPQFVWKNVHSNSNKVALECGITGRKYTYAQSRDAANYVARSLHSLGLQEGDIVALISPNAPESAIAFLGVLEAGMAVTTINPSYTVEEMKKQLTDSRAKAVITSAEIARGVLIAAESALPSDAHKIVIEDGTCEIPEGTIPFKDLVTRGRTLPKLAEENWSPDNLAVLPYSSGTTGLPKGVELTHRNLVADMVMVDKSLEMSTAENQEPGVIPAFLPFFHIYGMNVLMLPRLQLGSKLVTMPRFTPDIFLNVLDHHQCTHLFCVPPIVLFLGASPLVQKKHLEAMVSIFSGAAPLAESDVERVYKKFGMSNESLNFLQGYGMTECSGVTFFESSNSKYASIGQPISCSEARLVDPLTGQDIATPGQTGELWLRGPHIMRAYSNNPEATTETVVEGWLKTGDIAYFDQDHDFFITDRLKELVKVKGFQVPPAELEAILRTHPDVEDAAVVGIPDARSGEVPKAFVLRKEGAVLSEEQVQRFVIGKVAEYKELRGGVTFVESIPRNPSGKILRMKLKELYGK
ncbi:4-coumarate--CoA ligase 1 [Venturia canescens]|uniref:4-coumarate--CoA ligase 1 n=1 Tax=Venturia canescens TaxID=32260 RepID=UPI001C9BC211|nr:4-coumarate--CoA ligase 1 [Venturia canescens]